ncbi:MULTISPECIES: alpha/beta fold hydrolase [Mycobacteroides]|uniref:Alpha/beta hydrolase n=1 Tax=Mycobacteroides chelonae TaxID=1774 RepID=A0AB73TV57_MYCCH|nr:MULTISPECIES: alpha/beta hydrolase [Mycobacteroides]ARQ62698.1 alpha/beta hydrolase [Mycobacteroides abscessus subsp. massiliense]KRQ20504.1 alpha/beta hydrolase [Mycobacteroides sp. H072]KRQ34372.1 alpha/beta hydrolase [Mycobacteroides sp. H002]KRQ52619.1 alpha/beta hydrolase [Mycobacteroides sp. H054]KRQ70498.1 alpha/beta hydrolase [Mycobacteroides sp. H001]
MAHTLGASAMLGLPDGRALHYMRAGGGPGPTVVFESGLGASRSEWGLVVPLVAQHFPTVVYDRANLGRSDPDPAPRTLEHLAGDLGELLAALDAGPYILVGHSYGGTIALAAAGERSGIAGLVLVDHSDEQLDVCCGSSLKHLRQLVLAGRWGMGVLRRLRLLAWVVRRAASGLPEDVVGDLIAEDLTISAQQAAEAEERFFLAGLASLRQHRPVPGNIPVTVISGVKTTLLDRSIRAAFLAAHRRTAQRLDARHVLAQKSGHLVVFTEPQLVAEEIRRIAERIAATA